MRSPEEETWGHRCRRGWPTGGRTRGRLPDRRLFAQCIDAAAGNARNKDSFVIIRSPMSDASGETPDRLGVNFYGPLGIVGGLGSAARGYLAALTAAGISVSVIPVNEMFVHHASVGKAGPAAQRPRHPISLIQANADSVRRFLHFRSRSLARARYRIRSEEHTSELQSLAYLVCRLLLEKKKKTINKLLSQKKKKKTK